MTISAISSRSLVSTNSRDGAVTELQQALRDAGSTPVPSTATSARKLKQP